MLSSLLDTREPRPDGWTRSRDLRGAVQPDFGREGGIVSLATRWKGVGSYLCMEGGVAVGGTDFGVVE